MEGKTKLAISALGAGAAGAYFFDSHSGRRRRHVLRDRAVAAVRRPAKRAAAETRRKASYAAGVMEGTAHGAAEVEERLKGDAQPGEGEGSRANG